MIGFPLAILVLASQPPLAEGLSVPREGCQKVIAAIARSAQDLSRLPNPKPSSDDRTRLLLRAAARAALDLPPEDQVAGFCLGIALGLDDSTTLTGNFLFGRVLRGLETPEQRQIRLKALGAPTLQTRRDWCQHLVVSAGLTVLAGSDAARAAGILKEQLDARPGGSGFSLADLAADEAGIRLAEQLKQNPARLKLLANDGDLSQLLPPLKDFPEGWSVAEIEKRFGGLSDPRFLAELGRIREQVQKKTGLVVPP
jgi:hypothetical protein